MMLEHLLWLVSHGDQDPARTFEGGQKPDRGAGVVDGRPLLRRRLRASRALPQGNTAAPLLADGCLPGRAEQDPVRAVSGAGRGGGKTANRDPEPRLQNARVIAFYRLLAPAGCRLRTQNVTNGAQRHRSYDLPPLLQCVIY